MVSLFEPRRSHQPLGPLLGRLDVLLTSQGLRFKRGSVVAGLVWLVVLGLVWFGLVG